MKISDNNRNIISFVLTCTILLLFLHAAAFSSEASRSFSLSNDTKAEVSCNLSGNTDMIVPAERLRFSYITSLFNRIRHSENKSIRYFFRTFFAILFAGNIVTGFTMLFACFIICLCFTVLYLLIRYIHKTDGKSRPSFLFL